MGGYGLRCQGELRVGSARRGLPSTRVATFEAGYVCAQFVLLAVRWAGFGNDYLARKSSALRTKSVWNWKMPPCPASG